MPGICLIPGARSPRGHDDQPYLYSHVTPRPIVGLSATTSATAFTPATIIAQPAKAGAAFFDHDGAAYAASRF